MNYPLKWFLIYFLFEVLYASTRTNNQNIDKCFPQKLQIWKKWNVYLVLQKDTYMYLVAIIYLFKIWLAEYFKNNSSQTLLVKLKWSSAMFTFCDGWISKMAASSRHSFHFQIRSHLKSFKIFLIVGVLIWNIVCIVGPCGKLKKEVFKGIFLAWSSVKFRIFLFIFF